MVEQIEQIKPQIDDDIFTLLDDGYFSLNTILQLQQIRLMRKIINLLSAKWIAE